MVSFLQSVKSLLGFAEIKAKEQRYSRNQPKYYATKKLRQKGIKIDTTSKVIYLKSEPTGFVKKWCSILNKFGYVQQTLLDI